MPFNQTGLDRRAAWIASRPAAPEAKLRLFCFPSAGGGTMLFRAWGRRLPASIDVCPVQLPGREVRLGESPLEDFAPLLASLCEGLDASLDERPYALFGHSMGALLAFELARWRAGRGKPAPVRLLVSGHDAPSYPSRLPPLSTVGDTELSGWLRRVGGTPDEVFDHPELLSLVLDVLRADLGVCETYNYSPGAALSCPITVLGGVADPHTTGDGIDAWGAETTGSFAVRMFPGSHFFLQTSEADVLAVMARELQAAAEGGSV